MGGAVQATVDETSNTTRLVEYTGMHSGKYVLTALVPT